MPRSMQLPPIVFQTRSMTPILPGEPWSAFLCHLAASHYSIFKERTFSQRPRSWGLRYPRQVRYPIVANLERVSEAALPPCWESMPVDGHVTWRLTYATARLTQSLAERPELPVQESRAGLAGA